MRDLPARLGDAGLVLLSRAGDDAAARRAAARVSLATAAPVARFVHRLGAFERGGRRLDRTELAALRPFAFAGIADPAAFRRSLEEAGVALAGFRAFPDHHRFTAAELAALAAGAKAAGAETLLTTEKDAARLGWPADVAIARLDFEPRAPEDAAVVDDVLFRLLA
jgi:tetraacyldisaccharide 4'-kinase